ncbi:hypothetical protein SAMN05216564_11617 [Halopenitus persicus]|uniref:Uncharacterized protein n=1 Tax=Halopenitus persicus TaxID=1048396 RepID=A0A1H3NXM8_9EURY|nr:hypothetical protein SAMN05216564_11617 [Halopenitus persicus]
MEEFEERLNILLVPRLRLSINHLLNRFFC